jgi:hypothetical protein
MIHSGCAAAAGADLDAGPGHGTVLGVVILLLIVHLATGFIFVRDTAPDTDAARTGFPLDDAWIHMVYQRSVAETGRPFYNDGELENGFTSPLWMLAGALPHLAARFSGLSAVDGVKLLGVLFGWLASWAMLLLLRRLGCRLYAAAFGAFVLAFSPALTFAGVSGMEVCLAVFLMLAAFSTYAAGGFRRAGLLAGLAVLARPEAVMVFAALPVLYLTERIFGRRGSGSAAAGPDDAAAPSTGRALAGLLLPGIILMGLWAGYSLAVTGRPLPNTFYAKFQEGGLLEYDAFVRIIGEYAEKMEAWELAGLAVLTLAGLAGILVRRKRKLLCLTLPAFGAAFAYAICVTRDMPEGCTRFYYWWRYLVPALPFLWIPVVMGVDTLARLGEGGKAVAAGGSGGPGGEPVPSGRWKRLAGDAAAVVPAALAFAGLITASSPVIEQYAWNCQNINEVQVELGQWVAENVPQGATVAVNDAGAIRYFGKRRTIDLGGLNRHEGLEENDRGEGFPIADRMFIQLVLSSRRYNQLIEITTEKMRWLHARDVGYLVIFPQWFPDVDVAGSKGWVVPAAAGPPAMTGTFRKINERRSEHLTIVEAPPPGQIGQDIMCVYECVYRPAR